MRLRWMKKLLTCVFGFIGIFFTSCYISWLITGEEPEALITGVSSAVGVESIVTGVIRIFENKEQHKHEKEMQNGTEQNQLETETDQP